MRVNMEYNAQIINKYKATGGYKRKDVYQRRVSKYAVQNDWKEVHRIARHRQSRVDNYMRDYPDDNDYEQDEQNKRDEQDEQLKQEDWFYDRYGCCCCGCCCCGCC